MPTLFCPFYTIVATIYSSLSFCLLLPFPCLKTCVLMSYRLKGVGSEVDEAYLASLHLMSAQSWMHGFSHSLVTIVSFFLCL